MRRVRRRGGQDGLLLRLEMLGAVRNERVLRVMGGSTAKPLGGVATLDERELSPLVVAERGRLRTLMGVENVREREGRMRSGVRGVVGQPWT